MNIHMYCRVSALIFIIVALGHLTRVINGWPIDIGPMSVPMWLSWGGVVVPTLLAYWALKLTTQHTDTN